MPSEKEARIDHHAIRHAVSEEFLSYFGVSGFDTHIHTAATCLLKKANIFLILPFCGQQYRVRQVKCAGRASNDADVFIAFFKISYKPD